MKKKILIIVPFVVLIIAGFAVYQIAHQNNELIKIELGNEPCLAQEPGCGYCPGTRIDNECYVKKSEYEQF